MQTVDFYEFSRAIQDRFSGSVRGEGAPRPLLAIKAGVPREIWIGSGIGAGGLLFLVLLIGIGLGDLESAVAIHPAPFIAVYAILAGTVAIAVIQVLARLRATRSLPYGAGTYLFPSGVIEAKSDRLRIFPLSRSVTPVVGDKTLTLTFPEGDTFVFPLAVSGHSEEVKATILGAEDAMERAHASGDKKQLGVLDPLVDIGVVNPFAPKTRMEKNAPLWARQVWVVGTLIGVALASVIWFARNLLSDAQMLSVANRLHDSESFKAYLAHGGRRSDVREVLLPRAELSEAVKAGTVDAIEAFMAAHPGSRIQSEVSAALRQAMLAELETVKKVGTISELNEFSKRHPTHLVDAEFRQALHVVYQAAFAKYKKESGVRDPNIVAFIERLLTSAEKGGPKAEIRFRRKPTRSMELADTQIKKSPFFMGTASLPSLYFDDPHARQREAVVGKAIANRFAAAFPADILSLEMGPPIAENDGPLPPSKVPTMFIEHSAEMSGASYLSANPRGVFVGLGMVFDVTFRVPDEGKPQRYRLSTWRPPDTTPSRTDNDTFEAAVYESMANEGFAQFTTKYLATFFAKSEPKPSE